MVAISKSNKPSADHKSYKPISLLCILYKILERLIYACVEPIIDPLLPPRQAWFSCGKLAIDQVTLLTQTKESFLAKKKAGAVIFDLSNLRYCVVSQPHLQTSVSFAGQVLDLNGHGIYSQPQFRPHHQFGKPKQVATPLQCLTGISLGSTLI